MNSAPLMGREISILALEAAKPSSEHGERRRLSQGEAELRPDPMEISATLLGQANRQTGGRDYN